MTAVVHAAWTAAGAQPATPDATPLPSGTCARCGTDRAELTRVTGVISKLFTAFDTWHSPTLPGLCPPCAWAYRSPDLRQHPHLVASAGQLTQLTREQVADLLQTSSLTPSTSLVVPIRPGRKHLLPEARWGAITTDDATLPWSRGDASRLIALRRLRGHGFGSRMLTQPAPTWQVLRTKDPQQWSSIVEDWHRLEPWRQRPPWLAVALHVTTPPSTRRSA